MEKIKPDKSLTIEDFKLWSTKALKTFLAIRKKPVSGSFDTLVARLPKSFLNLI